MQTTSSSFFAGNSLGTCLMVLVGAVGCAGRHGASPKSAADAKPTIATVTEVDREALVVTMKALDGALSTVAVGDEVVFGRMEAGDKVRVDHLESMAFQILEPGHEDEQEYTNRTLPRGVLFGRRGATKAKILAVADEGKSTTFRCEDGTVHTMDAENKSTRALVATLHPGDDVEVTCTEKLAIELVR